MCLLAAHVFWTRRFFNETILLGDFCGLHLYWGDGQVEDAGDVCFAMLWSSQRV